MTEIVVASYRDLLVWQKALDLGGSDLSSDGALAP